MMELSWEVLFVFGIITSVFLAFVWEKFPPDLVAMTGFGALIVAGILSTKEVLSVFSSHAPITIGAMFIISVALERTGVVEVFGRVITRYAGKSQFSLLLLLMPVVIFMSAFFNNTPVVIILTPILMRIAHSLDMPATKVLIPLSFAAILGGATTLLGTSTNLIVSGLSADLGLKHFHLFDITLPGIILAIVGYLYMLFIGRHILPNRPPALFELYEENSKKYIAHLFITPESRLIGRKLDEVDFLKLGNTKVLDVLRNKESFRHQKNRIKVKPRDVIVIETDVGDLIGLSEKSDLPYNTDRKDFDTLSSAQDNILVQGIVGGRSKLINKNISRVFANTKISVYLLGLHRPEADIFPPFKRARFEVGDTLLIEGYPENLKNFFEEFGLINLSEPKEKPMRREKAPLVVATIVMIILFAAFKIMPVVLLAILGALFLTLTGCIEPEEVYDAVDWRILFLIFGMLGVSLGMEKTGGAHIIIDYAVQIVDHHGPLYILAIIYLLTSLLTEMITNNAVAVLLTPIVVGLAQSLQLSPTPFLVAIMFGASASFATPIGYQTNTFVYSVGGYKFVDFLKVGLPLNILMFAAAMVVIPLFWQF